MLLAAFRARAQQPRLGPYTANELEAARGKYEPYLRGLFVQDLIARLPPAMRAPLGDVHLEIPAEMPAGPGSDPAFVLNIGAVPATRHVYLPLRTAVWLEEYFTLAAHLERRKCPDRPTIALTYAAMLTRSGENAAARPPGPLRAFGLDDGVYADAFVKDVSNKLFAGTIFFLLAHELGHIARGHAGGATGIHSQIQEREADAYALDAMASVGAEPLGLAYFFTAAAMMEGGQTTHPLSGSRVEAAARALEERPRAFVDRAEPNPDAWVPRLLALARQIRQTIALIDDAQQRARLQQTAGRMTFADLRSIHEKFCPT
ncbi:MAG TPA: hypothetical protein VGF62_10730 [Rhizomicrobium sp.]